MTIDSQTERPNEFTQLLHAGTHEFHADTPVPDGGRDQGPSPHDLFDASLAACKGLTAHWYAKKNGYPLERVETQVTRDNSKEREGTYLLTVRVAFHGPLTDEQRQKLHQAVGKCPIHRLMTQVKTEIRTEPL